MRFDVSENLVRLAFLGLIIGFVFLIINGVASLAVPFAISFLLAFMLQPMVNGIEGLGLPRIIAALLSLLPVVGLFFFVTYTIIP
ncbi:MAG: hypothetical protein KDK34_21840, partial [Leptospiraceae bacterium]|nr:hypothetical protein [Leptospiraceae bacterium]